LKAIHLVFALLLIIAGITIFVLLSDPPIGAAGAPHATIAGISVGGDGTARLVAIGKAPFYFQLVITALSVVLLYMGVAAHRRDRQLVIVLTALAILNMMVWAIVYKTYETYLQTGEASIVGGFPVPTTWMLWGIWVGFNLFNLLYIVGFRRYFLPAEDEAAFEALVAELKAERKGA